MSRFYDDKEAGIGLPNVAYMTLEEKHKSRQGQKFPEPQYWSVQRRDVQERIQASQGGPFYRETGTNVWHSRLQRRVSRKAS